MTRLSQLTEGKLRVNKGPLFQAYVEEAEDEDLSAGEILITASESTIQASSCVLGLPLTDGHEKVVSKLHEALDDLMAAAGVYSSPTKRKRSQSPPKCFLRELSPAAKRNCCQLSDNEFWRTENYVNWKFVQGRESAQKSNTRRAETGKDRLEDQQYLRMMECTKRFLIDFPVEAAMNVLQRNAQLLLAREER